MHELALMEDLLTTIGQSVGGQRVITVRLEIGRLAAVMPAALQFCFEICTRGTSLEGAVLEIAEIQGRARCKRCDEEFPIEPAFSLCACGGTELQILAGNELRLKEVEVI